MGGRRWNYFEELDCVDDGRKKAPDRESVFRDSLFLKNVFYC